MTASYNNGSNFLYHTALSSSTPATGTLPSGIAVGDVMIVSVEAFTYVGGSPAFSTPTSGGSGSWTQVGSIGTSTQGSLVNYTTVWMKVATSGDAGSTFSIQFTGTNGSTNAYYWTGTVDFYTGFYTSSPIGAVGQTNAINASSITTPTIVTQQGNSWVLQIVESAISSSGTLTAGPSTNRRLYNPGDGIGIGVSDSNGSVGASGTSAGGGSFTLSNTSNGGASAFTIELTTQAGDAGTASVTLKKMTVSGSGGPILPTGTVDVTLKKMTVSGSGGPILPTGTVDVTLKKMTVSVSGGSLLPTGTAAVTLKKMTIAASGDETELGTASVTLKKMTVAVSGVLSTSGTANITLPKMTVAASGDETELGTASVTLKKMTVSASSGSLLPTGTAVITLRKMVVLASGSSTVILDTSVRLRLQAFLEGLDAEFHVYFQPPPNIQMVYPAIVYNRDYLSTDYADNLPYNNMFRWQITVIDADPDSPMHALLTGMPLMKFVRHYTSANLNHDIYDVYF